jgi:RES domain-containing protein
MVAPPPEAAKAEGRFNHYGQVVLYLGSSPTGALAEVLDRSDGECVAWLQEFRVSSVAKVIDLTSPEPWQADTRSLLTVGLEHNLRHWVPDATSPWKPEYFVPRFIADGAREAGLEGVMFESHKHYEKNLVLFNPTHTGVRTTGQPQLVVVSSASEKGRIREIEAWEPEF